MPRSHSSAMKWARQSRLCSSASFGDSVIFFCRTGITSSTWPEARRSLADGVVAHATDTLPSKPARKTAASRGPRLRNRVIPMAQGTTLTGAPSVRGLVSSAGIATASPSESPDVISTRVRFWSENSMACRFRRLSTMRKTYALLSSMCRASRCNVRTLLCAATTIVTPTLMFGSSRKSLLSIRQVVSPTFRLPLRLTVEGTLLTAPVQTRPGTASQVTSTFCPICKRPTSGSSTKARTSTCDRSATCKSMSPAWTNAQFNRQGIHDAIKGSAHARFAERTLRTLVGGLGLRSLRLSAGDLRRGVATFLFLFEQIQVSLGSLQSGLGLPDFSFRRGALLLQALQRIQISLGCVAGRPRLSQLRVQGQDFFLCSAIFCGGEVGLGRFDLSLRSGSLCTDVIVVELEQ